MKIKIYALFLGLAAIISPLRAMDQEAIADAQEIYDAFYPSAKINELIYDVNSASGMLSVFDTRINAFIKTIDVIKYSRKPLVIDRFLLVSSCDGTLIIDTDQDHNVISRLEEETKWKPILHNEMCYLFSESKIKMMDLGKNNEIIKEEKVCKIWVQPILHNNLLYHASNWNVGIWTNLIHVYETGSLNQFKVFRIPGYNFRVNNLFSFNQLLYAVVEDNWRGYLIVIDPSRDYAMQEIDFDHLADELFFYDGLLYLAAKFKGKIWVINPRENHKIVDEIEVAESPDRFIALGNLLYLSQKYTDTISVINPRENRVIKTLDIKRPSRF